MIQTTQAYWRIETRAEFGNQPKAFMRSISREQALSELRQAHPQAPERWLEDTLRDATNGEVGLPNGVSIARAR